ncbi:MAG: hypothetical protein AB7E95_03045 [Kiritimatiellales bacterium]
MGTKPIFIIIATITAVWALWSGALATGFEKIGHSEVSRILKIDKADGRIGAKSSVFQKKVEKISGHLLELFNDLGGGWLTKLFREQPVVSGMLFIFIGVSACGVAFIVHLIRSDARF